MSETKKELSLSDHINEHLAVLDSSEDLKEVAASASQITELARQAPEDTIRLTYLVRELLGRRAVKAGKLQGQITEDYRAGRVSDSHYLLNVLDTLSFGNPEFGAVMKQHKIDATAMRLGYLKGNLLARMTYLIENAFFAQVNQPAIKSIFEKEGSVDFSAELMSGRVVDPELVLEYVMSKNSIEDWAKVHAEHSVGLDGMLEYAGRIAAKTPHAELLERNYKEAAQLGIYSIGFLSDDETRDSLKDAVIKSIETLENIASKYAAKAGQEQSAEKALAGMREKRQKTHEKFADELLKTQDALYSAAETAAETNKPDFAKAKKAYENFTGGYLTVLDETPESFKDSLDALNELYEGKAA